MATTLNNVRPLYIIADDIRSDWKKVHPCAAPYLDAMGSLTTVNDEYGWDSGREIVCRFLCNAGSWRGDKAKAVKAELKKMVGLK